MLSKALDPPSLILNRTGGGRFISSAMQVKGWLPCGSHFFSFEQKRTCTVSIQAERELLHSFSRFLPEEHISILRIVTTGNLAR
jgi:hypothetical protein